LGHSNPCHSHPTRFSSCWNIPCHGDDQKQPKEGGKGESRCGEENQMKEQAEEDVVS
jgi:hypothetical protein